MKTLNNFKLFFEDLKPKVYTKNASGRSLRVVPPGALLTKHKRYATMVATIKRMKGTTRMKVIKKTKLGLIFDIAVGSVVILLNELAAFLYIRDNIKEQHVGMGIAGIVVFMSTYIVFKLIARLAQ